MKITVDLDYDAIDALFLQILYDGYEAAYFCHEEDVEKLRKDPTFSAHIRENFHEYIREDIIHNRKALDAYEVLAKHFSVGTEAEKRLQAIRDRVDYKYKIAEGMSSSNG